MSYKQWLGNYLQSEIPTNVLCPSFEQLATDSRNVRPGDWFIPLKGETFDGHTFIADAIERGASGIFTEKELSSPLKVPAIKVRNTMQAYHALATGWRKTLPASCELVAVTGSVGKTTVKTLIHLMLSHLAKTFCTPGNQNTDFAIPKALFQLRPDHRYGVFEFGARRPGDIALLTETVRPKISVCLNVASAHLGMFGNRETTMTTKLEIIGHAPQDSVAVTLHDDPVLLGRARDLGKKLISFGYHPEADLAIMSVKNVGAGMQLVFKALGKDLKLHLPVSHQSYPINVAAALAVGLALKIPIEKCREGLEGFIGIKGRYQTFKSSTGLTVIDDSYNASPESMKAGLASLSQSFPNKKKILILGDMRELGSFTEEAHRGLAKLCCELKPVALITVGQHAKIIADEAIKFGLEPRGAVHFSNSDELSKEISHFYKSGEIIYVKGSFAVQLSRVVEQIISENS